jgi:hypothetical protein
MRNREFRRQTNTEQVFDIKDPGDCSIPFSADLTGFSDTPRNIFKDQTQEFKEIGIKQLSSSARITVMRGSAISSIETILEKGVEPKNLNGDANVKRHRGQNNNSRCTSWSLSFPVALYFGATLFDYDPARPANAPFNVVAATINGQKYNAAGPPLPEIDITRERETTIEGRVDPEDIVGYRQCTWLKGERKARCGDVYTKPDLKSEETQNIVSLLCDQRVSTFPKKDSKIVAPSKNKFAMFFGYAPFTSLIWNSLLTGNKQLFFSHNMLPLAKTLSPISSLLRTRDTFPTACYKK